FLSVFVFSVFVLSSCSLYESDMQFNPASAKEIFIQAIANNTNKPGLESKITLAISEEMQNDGRLIIANSQDVSDGALSIIIKRYILRPLTYDANMVAEQYKLWVVFEVAFTDTESGEEKWKEDMEIIQIYLDANKSGVEEGEGLTEDQAQDAVSEKLARRITRRIIKGYI
ncbi:MAG: LPS assembly lipoprotein LptE, partial [Endomicrobium sp.]|nr:LPS assembly lipoprotein LptE [Endomicrobium sp.]